MAASLSSWALAVGTRPPRWEEVGATLRRGPHGGEAEPAPACQPRAGHLERDPGVPATQRGVEVNCLSQALPGLQILEESK